MVIHALSMQQRRGIEVALFSILSLGWTKQTDHLSSTALLYINFAFMPAVLLVKQVLFLAVCVCVRECLPAKKSDQRLKCLGMRECVLW